ncbi:MAG: WbqC family protein [Sciscionella sp.]
MRLGIMQPYFFPYLGHFGLIANCDHWVVFDITQYTPKTWMNRNRVLHPSAGSMYVTVPLSNSSQSILTVEARVQDPAQAHSSIRGRLSHYKRFAPFYREVLRLVDGVFEGLAGDSLVELDVAALRMACAYLELPFHYSICSELDLDLKRPCGPGGWAPAIAQALDADAYVNPAGGRSLFDRQDFARRGIDLLFAEMPTFVYDTGPFAFEPQLSILDVLMWNSPERVRETLDTATLTSA